MEPSRLSLLPLRERPTERIYAKGPEVASLLELLSTVLGGGKQLELAEQLVARYPTLKGLFNAPLSDICRIAGIGRKTAGKLIAALELGKRLAGEGAGDLPQIRGPADAGTLLQPEMSVLEQEELRVMLLNTRNRVMAVHTVYIGSVNTAIVRVAEVLREPVRFNATAIIIAHNHPSGDPTPSPEDVRVTERIVKGGKIMDIDVVDHLIIGAQHWVSMKERGLGFSDG